MHIHACYEAAHIHTYIHTYIHPYMHTYIHACMHTYIHTCIHTNIHTNIHTYIQTDRHAYMPAYLHTTIPIHHPPTYRPNLTTYIHLIHITHAPQKTHTHTHAHEPTCVTTRLNAASACLGTRSRTLHSFSWALGSRLGKNMRTLLLL